MHREETHGEVRLVPEPPDVTGYARMSWAVMFGGDKRGRVVRPAAIGAPYEAWSMHVRPHARAEVGKAGLLGRSAQVDPDAARAELAARFASAHGRGAVPTEAELSAAGWRKPEDRRRRGAREPTLRQALGGIRVSEPARPRTDEEGNPLPGIGYIP